MTIAVCVSCGAQKFGALVPCGRCGFEPQSVIEQAKSITLSDHFFPMEQLSKCQAAIEAGQQIAYDFLLVASIAGPILDEAYFWDHFDEATGVLACKQCGKVFTAELEEVYCASCSAENEEPLSACANCRLLYGQGARYCQKCGKSLSLDPRLTTKSIGTKLALFARRAVISDDPLAKYQYLTEFRDKLSDEERITSKFELEILGMYVAMLTLQKYLHSKDLLVKSVRDMVGLHRESLILQGADAQTGNYVANLCINRFDQYDRALAVEPEQWMLSLANEATKNCFQIERHIGAAMEMSVAIGHFTKVFDGALRAVTFRE